MSIPGIVSDAELSPDGLYRYVLNRRWGLGTEPVMAFIGLNPSTADATADDPTIRRMCGFARREGCRGICVVNLYALRSPDPSALARHPDPVGPDNDRWLDGLCAGADGPVIAAWGAHPVAARRAASVTALVTSGGGTLCCLGRTRKGEPRHPLYLRSDARLEAL